MRTKLLFTAAAVPLLALAAGPLSVALDAAPAAAQTAPASGPANGAYADGYGLYVNATLLAGNVPVNVPPVSRATSSCPPQATTPPANLVQVGPVPATGDIVQNASAVSGTATTDCSPTATATGSASNVQLLATKNLNPQITADVLKGVSNSSCTADPNGKGSQFVNLTIGGQAIPATPPPNTVVPLGVLTVIVNEQHPAYDGRGFVVNALHIFGNSAAAGLFTGDVIVGHAYSSVTCQNGAGTTGPGTGAAANPIQLTKTANPTSTSPGGTVTYTVAIKNSSTTADCLVNQFTDHLAPVFTYVSTSGDLGTTATAANRPGGGQDVTILAGTKPVTIKKGTTATQTFTVTANPDAAPGTYANDVEILCSDLGNFVGRGAPVTISVPTAAPVASGNNANGATTATLPRTGGPGPAVPAAGAAILAGAVALGSRRRTLRNRAAATR